MSDSKQRFERVRDLWIKASSLSADECESLLANEAMRDPKLAEEVRSLLLWKVDDGEPRIADFDLGREIGRGGQGTVFEARRKDGQRVAIKIIASKLFGDGRELKGRFRREHHALASMSHPAIARFHQAGVSEQGDLFLVMEFVDGVEIHRYCDRQRLDLRRRVDLMIDVCSGVEHAHELQLLHRDLKPANVHVTEIGSRAQVKILDFGLVKPMQGAAMPVSYVSGPDAVVGSLEYMAPEQAQAKPRIDQRVDVYALGAMLCELLTGEAPLHRWQRGQPITEQLNVIERREPVAPSELFATAGDRAEIALDRCLKPRVLHEQLLGLDRLVLRCLAKQPSRRCPDIATLRKGLVAWRNGGG